MEDCWPFGAALRGEASNRPLLRWLKTVVVSDEGKGARDASGGVQEGVALKVPRGIHRLIASLFREVASKPGVTAWPGIEPGGCPDCWPGGVRRRGGASLDCGFRAERWKACPDNAARKGRREGEFQASETRGIEYRRGARRRTSS